MIVVADEEILSQFLNYITVTTITNSECAAVYGDAVLESMVCTSAGSDPVKGACIVSLTHSFMKSSFPS